MFSIADRPSWAEDAADWPNRTASRFMRVAGLDWHVQIMGEGPPVLLLHGTGASTHSWAAVATRLATRHQVVVPDLPGHGFTAMPGSEGLRLQGMARSVSQLLDALDIRPQVAIGHSAGAAILVAMALSGRTSFRRIISVNGALLPIRHAGLFGPLARLLFLNPFAPRLFALRGGSSDAVRRLIEGTGSRLDDRGVALYVRLLRRAGHIEGALGMMANWDLDGLQSGLRQLRVPLVLVTAPNDRAVPPRQAGDVARNVPEARVVDFGRGGHLAHEEFPGAIAELLEDLIAEPQDGV